MKQQLIFVYNADSGLFNSVTDFAHKIISPSTYQCSLCALTYGNLSMKKEWKDFIQQLALATTFLHKNEFANLYHLQTNYPAVFINEEDSVKQIISAEEINLCISLNELKTLVTQKLKQHLLLTDDEH